ncbi:MAG: tautomerase family protein [Methanobacteriaceae archaeon]|jgi:4-oxalocrotonate tautomerase|nr:tautomerase family protein [Candidatus Methanorudis spinitermitis]
MPVVIIESNKINIEKKRELVKSITEITSKIYELPKNTVTVLIKELERENVGVSGKLLSEINDE